MKFTEIKTLNNVIEKLNTKLDSMQEFMESKQDIFDNRSEAWQESEVGGAYAQKIEDISDQIFNVEEVIGMLQDAVSILEENES